MTELTEFIQMLGVNVTYTILFSGMWLAITAVYVPGTGFPEIASLLTLFVGGAGLFVMPTNVVGLLILIAALTCFLLLIYFRDFTVLI